MGHSKQPHLSFLSIYSAADGQEVTALPPFPTLTLQDCDIKWRVTDRSEASSPSRLYVYMSVCVFLVCLLPYLN